MKFYLAILLVIMAVAVAADKDDDLWKSYKVYVKYITWNKVLILFFLYSPDVL